MKRVLLFLVLIALGAPAFGDPPPMVAIRRVAFVGVHYLSIWDRHRIASDLRSRKYATTDLEEIPERTCLALQDRGFFKCVIRDFDVQFAPSEPIGKMIDVTLTIEEGVQYRLSGITPHHETLFSVVEIQQQFDLDKGDIFNRGKFTRGLENLRALYASKGYINFTVVPETVIDDNSRTILVNLDLLEGQPFAFGKLTFSGMEPRAGVEDCLLNDWRNYTGNRYDPKLEQEFARKSRHCFPQGAHHLTNFEVTPDNANKIVNVQVGFPSEGEAKR